MDALKVEEEKPSVDPLLNETKQSNAPDVEPPALDSGELELLACVPPERVIVSDNDVSPDHSFREREQHQERLRAKLTPQQVVLHPNVTVSKHIWLTPQHVLYESQQPNGSGQPGDQNFKAVHCYHDNELITGHVRFPATSYDTTSDKFEKDVTFPFCSSACLRATFQTERPAKWAETIFWSNESVRREFGEAVHEDAHSAPPRGWLASFCLIEEETELDIFTFREAVQPVLLSSSQQQQSMPQWDCSQSRLCTTMEDKAHLEVPCAAAEEEKSQSDDVGVALLQQRAAISGRLLTLCPFQQTSRLMWLTAAELLQSSKRDGVTNQFISPVTHQPYRRTKHCYHDGGPLGDTLRFAASDFDTITDRFLVDVSVGYCSAACTRATLRTERQGRFMDRLHYTNEMTKRVFCEYNAPRFAPPRNVHTRFCARQGAGQTAAQMRNAVGLKHATELLHPRLEPIPIRLCTMMPPPRLIKAVGDIGERRPYITIVSASNQQPPMAVEKPPVAQPSVAAQEQPPLRGADHNNPTTFLWSRQQQQPNTISASLASTIGLPAVQSTPFTAGHQSQAPPPEVVLASGQLSVTPSMSGLSKSYGIVGGGSR